jgi:hypothetical protein
MYEMAIEKQLAARRISTIGAWYHKYLKYLEDVEDQIIASMNDSELQAGESRILQVALLEAVSAELHGPASFTGGSFCPRGCSFIGGSFITIPGSNSEASFRRSDTSLSSSFSTMSRSTSRTPTPAKNSCTDQTVDNLLVINRKKGRSSAFSRLLSVFFPPRSPKHVLVSALSGV